MKKIFFLLFIFSVFNCQTRNQRELKTVIHRFPQSYEISSSLSTIGIYNINLGKKDLTPYGDHRIKNIAELLLKKQPWGLIGVNECKAKRDPTKTIQVELAQECGICNDKEFTTKCLYEYLRRDCTTPNIVLQKGEIGVIADPQRFEMIGQERIAILGYFFPGTLRRRVLGARFKLKGTDHVIPFYSTHISYFIDHWFTRDMIKSQLEDLVKAIKKWWITNKGDWTPIIVGDFNSHCWKPNHWAIMEKDFERLTKTGLDDRIEHIWFGKMSSFPGSRGTLISRTNGEVMNEFKDGSGENYTDHPAIFAKTNIFPSYGSAGGKLVSWGVGRLDFFERGSDNRLKHIWYEAPHGWHSWEDLGGVLNSDPVAVSWGYGRLDIFAKSINNRLLHLWYDRSWGRWEEFPGEIQSTPSVVSWGPARLDIFAKGNQNNLLHFWYDANGVGWGRWEDKGGNIDSTPTAVSWGVGRLDIFAISNDGNNPGKLKHLWFDDNFGNGWGSWEDLGGNINARYGINVVTWGFGRLDIFGIGPLLQPQHIWYDGRWGYWEEKGGVDFVEGGLGVISWGYGRLDIFGKGFDSNLRHLWFGSAGWGYWEPKGGDFSGPPEVVTWSPGSFSIITKRRSDRQYQHMSYDEYGNGWSDWHIIGSY